MTKVNKRKITKTMCYNLVRKKRLAVIEEKHHPFRKEMSDKINARRREIIEEAVDKSKIEMIAKQSEELLETIGAIRDDLSYGYYVNYLIDNLNNFNSDNIYDTLSRCVNTRDSEVERMYEAIDDDQHRYIEEFDKVYHHLKSLKTGGQCYDFLKSIGFDVTPLEEQVEKYELSPIEVNKDLLGLSEASK